MVVLRDTFNQDADSVLLMCVEKEFHGDVYSPLAIVGHQYISMTRWLSLQNTRLEQNYRPGKIQVLRQFTK